MAFKENLKRKIQLDRLVEKVSATIRETPGQRRVDKTLIRSLLALTDFQPMRVRGLDLYVRPLQGESKEVLVLDNELAIYHTTVADVVLRKNPFWKEMFSFKNIRKILDDKDVVVSKGRESLARLHSNALGLLDLSYDRQDLVTLVEEARLGLEQKSLAQIQESFELFFELLDFQALPLALLQENLQVYASPKTDGGTVPLFENLLLFNEETLAVALRKGTFSPESELDRAWIAQYARGSQPADLQGLEVFEFLAEMALQKRQAPAASSKS